MKSISKGRSETFLTEADCWLLSLVTSASSCSIFDSPSMRKSCMNTIWFSPKRSILTSALSSQRSNSLANIFMPTGTLQTPMNRRKSVCRWTASVIRPAGLVKLISQAFGQSSSMSLMMEKTTGIVRSALNNPPAPLVSCPSTP
ncbi:hypothetical protein D3C81_1518490 [compost metagenome]